MIGRRALLAALAAALGGPAAAQGRRRARIGIVLAGAAPAYVEAFQKAFATLGDGVARADIRLAEAGGDPAALPTAIAELIAWQPDIIISSSGRTHLALRDATASIPVVAVSAVDPVAIGLTDSIARPSRNFTGTVGLIDGLMQKRLELLREVLPNAKHVAIHLDPSNPNFPATIRPVREFAPRLGLEIIVAGYSHRDAVVAALDRAKAEGADAAIVLPDGIALAQMDAIAARVALLRLPTLGFNENELRLGLTFVLGADRMQLWRDAAATADRIVRGAKVADIPFQEPTKIFTGVNLKAARAMGVDVPLSVIVRADEVIE